MADEEDQLDDENQEDVDGDGSEEGIEGEEGGSSKKKLLLILVPIVLLLGGGAAAYFTGMLDSMLGVEAESVEGEHGEDGGKDANASKKGDHGDDEAGYGESAFLAIPTMIVNLNTDDGTPRFLRLTVQLELENPQESTAVEAIIPRVIDQFQTYLRELRVRDLKGSAGIYRLQMELLWRVNQAAAPIKIKDVLFQEILIQ